MLVRSLRIGDHVVRKSDGCRMIVVSIRPAGQHRMAAYCAHGEGEQYEVSRYFSYQIEKARPTSHRPRAASHGAATKTAPAH
jgi:hypothetical protein